MRFASRPARVSCRVRALPLAAALLCGSLAGPAQAQDLYVICHPSVALAASDLRDVFLGEKQFAGEVRLAPADNNAARASFLEKVLKMDAAKYLTAWTKKSFRDGVNPPVVRSSDLETLEYVRRAPGRCSYITSTPGPGVSVVARF